MAEVYDASKFSQLYNVSRNPTPDQLGLAGRHICVVLASNRIPFAFVGGWAIYLRGGGRPTPDIDVAVRTDMTNLRSVLAAQPRFYLPPKNRGTSIQVFVASGFPWDCSNPACLVRVDMIIGGNLGTPARIPVGTERIIPVPTAQGNTSVYVPDLYNQIVAKLHAFRRRSSHNDFLDLCFLFSRYADDLRLMGKGRGCFNRLDGRFFCDQYAEREPWELGWRKHFDDLLKY